MISLICLAALSTFSAISSSKRDQYLCPFPARMIALAAIAIGLWRFWRRSSSILSSGVPLVLILKNEASALSTSPLTHWIGNARVEMIWNLFFSSSASVSLAFLDRKGVV